MIAPPLAIACLREALAIGERGDTSQALDIVRGVLRAYPELAPAWNALAGLHRARREPLAVAICLARCLDLDPGHGPANLALAEFALRIARPERARLHILAALRRAGDLSPRRRAWAEALSRHCASQPS
jgi:tetratricopeptide (TPR) repeat protein